MPSVLGIRLEVDDSQKSKFADISSAAQKAQNDLNSRFNSFNSPLTSMEYGLNRVGGAAARLADTGFSVLGASVRELTGLMTNLGSTFLTVNERFSGLQIALSSSMRNFAAAKDMIGQITALSSRSPVPLMDMANVVQGLIAVPAFNQRLLAQSQSGQSGNANGFMQQVINLVGQMGVLRPDQGADSAVFALREALTAGRLRSLTYRYGISPQALDSASGMQQKALVKDPEKLIAAIEKVVSSIVSPEALALQQRQPTVMFQKFMEQLVTVPSLHVGQDAGANGSPFTALTVKAQKAYETFISYMTTTFETDMVPKLQTSLMTSANRIFDSLGGILDHLLDTLGLQEGGTGIEKVMNGIVDLFVLGARKLADMVDYVKSSGVIDTVVKIIMGFINATMKIVDMFVGLGKVIGPTGAALVAFASPAILQNFGSFLAMFGRFGSMLNGIGGSMLGQGAQSLASAGASSATLIAQGALRNANGYEIKVDSLNALLTNLAKAETFADASPIAAEISGMHKYDKNSGKLINGAVGSRMGQLSTYQQSLAGNAASTGGMLASLGKSVGGVFLGMAAAGIAGLAIYATIEGGTKLYEALTRNSNAIEYMNTHTASDMSDFAAKADLAGGNRWRVARGMSPIDYSGDSTMKSLFDLKNIDPAVAGEKTTGPSWTQRAISALMMGQQTSNGGIATDSLLSSFQQQNATAMGVGDIPKLTSALIEAIPEEQLALQQIANEVKNDPGRAQNELINWRQNFGEKRLSSRISAFGMQKSQQDEQAQYDEVAKNFGTNVANAMRDVFNNQINGSHPSEIAGALERGAGMDELFSRTLKSSSVLMSPLAESISTDFSKKLGKGASPSEGIENLMEEADKAAKALGTLADQQKVFDQARKDTSNYAMAHLYSKDAKDTLMASLEERIAGVTSQMAETGKNLNSIMTNTPVEAMLMELDKLATGMTRKGGDGENPYGNFKDASEVNKMLAILQSKGIASGMSPLSSNALLTGGKASGEDISASESAQLGNLTKFLKDLQNIPGLKKESLDAISALLDKIGATGYRLANEQYNIDSATLKSSVRADGTFNPDNLPPALANQLRARGMVGTNSAQDAANRRLFPGMYGQTGAMAGINNQLAVPQILQGLNNADIDKQNGIIGSKSSTAADIATANAQLKQDLTEQKLIQTQIDDLLMKQLEITTAMKPSSFISGMTSQLVLANDQWLNFAQMGQQTGQAIQQSFGNAFLSIIQGTQKAGAAFRQMASTILSSMAQILAQQATKGLLSMVFSGMTSFFGSGAGTGVGAAADFGGEMASGGLITGGSGNRDDVPILAMGGEFVLNKRAAQNIGYSTLHALNSMSNVRHYADGGVVNGPGSSGIYAGGGGGYVHNSNVQIHIDNTGNMKVDAEEQGKQSAGLAEALEGLLEQRLQDKFRSGAMFNPVSGKYTR